MIKSCLCLLLLAPSYGGDGAAVSGTVLAEGKFPRIRPFKPGDPHCIARNPNGVPNDTLVLGEKGELRGALVYVRKGLEGKTFPVPADPILIDQVDCRYVPHVIGIRAGQSVTFRNSDQTLHNVKGDGFSNPSFNFAQAVQGQVDSKTFKQAEVPFKLQCNVHSWMSAWIGIFDHPFFAVTGPDGKFELKGLPPGKYTLSVWHERLIGLDREIEVKADAAVSFTLTELKP